MKVKWSKPALADLDDIVNYIASDIPERAISFILKLMNLGDSLANPGMAEKGTYAKWTKDPSIRELYYGNYAIIYEILQDTVMIHEVHHSAKLFRHFIR